MLPVPEAPNVRTPEPRLTVCPAVLTRLRVAPRATVTAEVARAAALEPVRFKVPPFTTVEPV